MTSCSASLWKTEFKKGRKEKRKEGREGKRKGGRKKREIET